MTNPKFRVWDGEEMHEPDEIQGRVFLDPHGQVWHDSAAPYGDIGVWEDAEPLFYTGLTDAEGTEIYEGDVLEIAPSVWNALATVQYIHGEAGFILIRERLSNPGKKVGQSQATDSLSVKYSNHCTVRGNVHEHPGLLERPNRSHPLPQHPM